VSLESEFGGGRRTECAGEEEKKGQRARQQHAGVEEERDQSSFLLGLGSAVWWRRHGPPKGLAMDRRRGTKASRLRNVGEGERKDRLSWPGVVGKSKVCIQREPLIVDDRRSHSHRDKPRPHPAKPLPRTESTQPERAQRVMRTTRPHDP
jgi:hypothetical protein